YDKILHTLEINSDDDTPEFWTSVNHGSDSYSVDDRVMTRLPSSNTEHGFDNTAQSKQDHVDHLAAHQNMIYKSILVLLNATGNAFEFSLKGFAHSRYYWPPITFPSDEPHLFYDWSIIEAMGYITSDDANGKLLHPPPRMFPSFSTSGKSLCDRDFVWESDKLPPGSILIPLQEAVTIYHSLHGSGTPLILEPNRLYWIPSHVVLGGSNDLIPDEYYDSQNPLPLKPVLRLSFFSTLHPVDRSLTTVPNFDFNIKEYFPSEHAQYVPHDIQGGMFKSATKHIGKLLKSGDSNNITRAGDLKKYCEDVIKLLSQDKASSQEKAEVQAPIQEEVQAPNQDRVQAPNQEEVQVPSQEEVQAEVQAPIQEEVQINLFEYFPKQWGCTSKQSTRMFQGSFDSFLSFLSGQVCGGRHVAFDRCITTVTVTVITIIKTRNIERVNVFIGPNF
ncbi:hypothetical protein (Partial), partial [Seminavis robusta]